MKNIILWLLFLVPFVGVGQDTTPIMEKFGINTQKHSYDQVYLSNNNPTYPINVLENLTTELRYFLQQEDDYPNVAGRAPGNNEPAFVGYQLFNSADISTFPVGGWDYTQAQLNTVPYADRRMQGHRDRLKTAIEDGFRVQNTLMMFNNGRAGNLGFPNRTFEYSELLGGNSRQAAIDSIAKYAYAYASLFDQSINNQINGSNGENLSPFLEIQNEPWGVITADGNRIFLDGFVKGLTQFYGTGDPTQWGIKLIAPAMQAFDPTGFWGDSQGGSDYIGSFTTGATFANDTLVYANVHNYGYQVGPFDGQLTYHPEDPNGKFREELETMIDWLDNNGAPNVEVIATEYGYDSGTVGEAAQAIYLVRATLILGANPRVAYHYMYEDVDNPALGTGVYSTSGLLTATPPAPSVQRKQGQDKQAYRAALQMKNALGDARVIEVLAENPSVYCYLLEKSNGDQMIAVWKPDNINNDATPDDPSNITISYATPPTQIGDMYKIDGNIGVDATLGSTSKGIAQNGASRYSNLGNAFTIEASPVPYLYEIGEGTVSGGGGTNTATAFVGFGDGSLEKQTQGKLSNIFVNSGTAPNYTITANFNSDQFSIAQVDTTDKVTIEYLQDIVVFRIDSIYNVSGSQANFDLVMEGDQSYNLPAFPASDAVLMKTTEKGLLTTAVGMSEFTLNRIMNSNILRIDSLFDLISTGGSGGTGTPQSLQGYDNAGQPSVYTSGQGISIANGRISAVGRITTVLGLTDTPNSYDATRMLRVNAAGTGYEHFFFSNGAIPFGIANGGIGYDTNNNFSWRIGDNTLDVRGNGITIKSELTRMLSIDNYRDESFYAPEISFNAYEGTLASPSALRANKQLGQLKFFGFDGTQKKQTASILTFASENYTATGTGSRMEFSTTPNGATNKQTVFQLNPNGQVRNNLYGQGNYTFTTGDYIPVFSANGTIGELAIDNLKNAPYSDIQHRYKQDNAIIRNDDMAAWGTSSVFGRAILKHPTEGQIMYFGASNSAVGDARAEISIGAYIMSSPTTGRFYTNNPIIDRNNIGLGGTRSGFQPFDVIQIGNTIYLFGTKRDNQTGTISVMTADINTPFDFGTTITEVITPTVSGVNGDQHGASVMLNPDNSNELLIYFAANQTGVLGGEYQIYLASVTLGNILNSGSYSMLNAGNPVMERWTTQSVKANYPYIEYSEGEYTLWYSGQIPNDSNSRRACYKSTSTDKTAFTHIEEPVISGSLLGTNRKDNIYATAPYRVGNYIYYQGRPTAAGDYEGILVVPYDEASEAATVGSSSVWSESPSNSNNIFYDTGNVGIGTNEPRFGLEVFQPTSTATMLINRGNGTGVQINSGGTASSFVMTQGRGSDVNAQTFFRVQGQAYNDFFTGSNNNRTAIFEINSRAPLNSFRIIQDGSVSLAALAGSGTRNVSVAADGTLVASNNTASSPMLIANEDADGTSTLIVASASATATILAIDVQGQGIREGTAWTASGNTITFIDTGSGFPSNNTWIRVWYID